MIELHDTPYYISIHYIYLSLSTRVAITIVANIARIYATYFRFGDSSAHVTHRTQM